MLGLTVTMTGDILSHYRILDQIGEGGMGVVYRALDTHLDRTVAIKVLRPETVGDPERKWRFAREAKAASALNHPNIVTIHDIDTADGVDFIAMESVDGAPGPVRPPPLRPRGRAGACRRGDRPGRRGR
jgi:serine/threonine protein kinase